MNEESKPRAARSSDFSDGLAASCSSQASCPDSTACPKDLDASSSAGGESSPNPRRLMAIPGVFYGGGCSYMACRGLMMGGIEDVLLITHGPVGCAYYSGINGYRGKDDSPCPSFAGRVFSTNMSESDIIFGGEKLLTQAIDEAVELFHPSAIAICSNCPVGLIGDDINQVASDASLRHGIDILPLSCEGFKSEPGWLHAGKQIADQWVGKESRPVGKFPIHFMSESYEGDRRDVIESLLGGIGYEVVCSMMGITTYQDIKRCQDARLIVLDSGKAIDEVPLLLKEKFGCGFMRINLTGIGNILYSLRAMASFFSDDELDLKTEAVITAELERIGDVREELKNAWDGVVVAVLEDIFRSDAYASLATEVGMDVIMVAQDYDAEAYTEEGYTVYVPIRVAERLPRDVCARFGLDNAEMVDALPGSEHIYYPERTLKWARILLNHQSVTELLNTIAPQMCFTGIEEYFAYSRATIRSELFLSDERGTDYSGFPGLDLFGRDIAIARDMSQLVFNPPAWADLSNTIE